MSVTPVPEIPKQLSLQETLRVMDVASALRKQRENVEQQFQIQDEKQRLREYLRQTAEVTGEKVSDAEVEAAINWYYANLHSFAEPPRSFSTIMAHVYVRRWGIGLATAGIFCVMTLAWWLFFSASAPLSPSNRRLANVENRFRQIQELETTIRRLTGNSEALGQLDAAMSRADGARHNQDQRLLDGIHRQLVELDGRLRPEYVISIVSASSEQSGFPRLYEDDKGQRVSGYYVVVEARDANGGALLMRIRNSETDTYEQVTRWAERVPKLVYDRLVEDKTSDGVLNETKFGHKPAGELEEMIDLVDETGKPISRLGQITRW